VPEGGAERTADGTLATLSREIVQDVERCMEAFDPGGALAAIWKLVEAGNGDIDTTAPWKRHKAGDTQGVADALYAALEAVRIISILLTPLLPHVAEVMRQQLGLSETPLGNWAQETRWGGLSSGMKTLEGQPIFPRIDTKANSSKQKELTIVTENTPPPPPPLLDVPEVAAAPTYITIDDFAKIQLKIGQIMTAERVEGATKLLKLTVDIGEETPRQILAGIAESYLPESLPGKKIVVVANLAPRKMRGLESQGMLMAATDAEGHAILLHPADPDAVMPGAQVR